MKMTQLTTSICGALVASIMATTAGTIPYGVHHDATWFAHVDLQALKATTVGQTLLAQLAEGDANNKLAALSAVLNFDPRSDLVDLTLYGFGKDRDGAVIVRGAFDAERLVTLVKAGADYVSEQYGEHLLHSWTDNKKCGTTKRAHGTVFSDDIVVFADDVAVLKQALDVLDRRVPSLTSAERFPGLSDSPRGGVIFAAANMTGMTRVDPGAQIFKAANSAVLTLGEAEGLVYADVVIETASAEAAGNMKRILDGMAALALLNREANPAAARLAEKAASSVEGPRLTVTLWSPVQDVLDRMEKLHP